MLLIEEIWKGLIYHGEDLSELYEISTKGRLRNSRTKYILRYHLNRGGYLYTVVSLGKKNKKAIIAHRAVAFTFIINQDNLPQINHKDGNKQNNCVKNLEWCTCKYNNNHAIAIKLTDNYGENNPRSKLKNEDVKNILLFFKNKQDIYHKGIKQIANYYGVNIQTIKDIIYKRRWQHLNIEK